MNRIVLGVIVFVCLVFVNSVNNERIAIGVHDMDSLDIVKLCEDPNIERLISSQCAHHKKRIANWIVVRSVEAVFRGVSAYFLNPTALVVLVAGAVFLLWISPNKRGGGGMFEPIYIHEQSRHRVGPPRYGQVVMIGDDCDD